MIKKVSEIEWEISTHDDDFSVVVEADQIEIAGETISYRAIETAHAIAKTKNPKHHYEMFIEFLENHEGDIALGINDFGDLAGVFEEYIGRRPKAE